MRFIPLSLSMLVLVAWTVIPCAAQETSAFRRGDSNSDREVDLSDSVHILGFLFSGSPATLSCPDASDVNDSGNVDIADAVAVLSFLYQSGPLPQPGLECGTDPTDDSLGCQAILACAVLAEEPARKKKDLEDDGFTCVPQIGGESLCSKCDAQGHCVSWKCTSTGLCIEILPASLDGDPLWDEDFALHAPTKLVADVDGDGRDDAVAFTKSSGPVDGRNTVLVALSNGEGAFFATQVWHTSFAEAGDDCDTADVNGDGQQDIVALRADGSVSIGLSEGFRFHPTVVQEFDFRQFGDSFLLGDVNNDDRDDLILLTKDTKGGAERGDVWVCLSLGNSFQHPLLWHGSFGTGGEPCRAGDFNADGKVDLVGFPGGGHVDVVLSNGATFLSTQRYFPGFSPLPSHMELADMNRDGRVDVIGVSAAGDVQVALSDGTDFPTVLDVPELFCDSDVGCQIGDPNGDGFGDLIDFVLFTTSNRTAGDVLVAISPGLPAVEDDGPPGSIPGPGPSPGPIAQ